MLAARAAELHQPAAAVEHKPQAVDDDLKPLEPVRAMRYTPDFKVVSGRRSTRVYESMSAHDQLAGKVLRFTDKGFHQVAPWQDAVRIVIWQGKDFPGRQSPPRVGGAWRRRPAGAHGRERENCRCSAGSVSASRCFVVARDRPRTTGNTLDFIARPVMSEEPKDLPYASVWEQFCMQMEALCGPDLMGERGV